MRDELHRRLLNNISKIVFGKLSFFDRFLFGHLLVKVKRLHRKPFIFTDVLARKMNDSGAFGDILTQYCDAMAPKNEMRCKPREVIDILRTTLLTVMFLQRWAEKEEEEIALLTDSIHNGDGI